MPLSGKSTAAKGRAAKQAYQVFLSHSSADLWIAGQMRKELEARGIAVWLDERDLAGGDIVLASIEASIRASDEVLVLVSPESLKSQWVGAEIALGYSNHKRVTPVLLYVAPERLGLLSGAKAVELNDFDHYLREVRQRAALRK